MLRLLYPLIFSMAIIPESDKHLENLQSVAQATQMTVKNIKDGMDGFHSNVMNFYQIFNGNFKQSQDS
jgi:hypothetical protein